MIGSTRIVLLSVGLCLAFCYVNAAPAGPGGVRLFGQPGLFGEYRDESRRLAEMKSKESALEARIQTARYPVDRYYMKMDLQSLRARIAHLEATLKVPYKDYLESLSGERRSFENERNQLRRQLVEAENKRLQAVEALEAQERSKGAEIASYQEKLDRLTEQRNKIAKQYAAFTEKLYQQEEKARQEKNQLLSEKGQLQQTLDSAKSKHAQAFDALMVIPTEGYKPVSLPEQDEINNLRKEFAAASGNKDRKQLKAGLESTKTKLEELLERLEKEGRFSTKTSREDLMEALSEMEKKVIVQREEKEKEMASISDSMKKKDVTKYDEEEISSLRKTGEDVQAADIFQREIARRNAYLRGVLEVSDLLKDCTSAIRDVNERNLANLWADAIQEAKDSPLGKLWAQSLQDAKDSEFAKAWADAIQGAKNSKIAQAWTNAIQEAKDINLAQAWTDAVQNLKDSSLAKMWTNAVQNAKDSPFTKYCSNAIENAKNSVSQMFTKKK